MADLVRDRFGPDASWEALWGGGRGPTSFPVAELHYLAGEALHGMDRSGDLWPCGGTYAPARGLIPAVDGWDDPSSHGFEIWSAYRPTAQLLARVSVSGWLTVSRWPIVNALADEAMTVYRSGHRIAAALAARVAVEEAVKQALGEMGGTPDELDKKPWEREKILFDRYLTSSKSVHGISAQSRSGDGCHVRVMLDGTA